MMNIAAGIITVITTIITVWIGACHGSFGEEKVTACSWEKGRNVLKAIRCMTQGQITLFFFLQRKIIRCLIGVQSLFGFPPPKGPASCTAHLTHGARPRPAPEAPTVKETAITMQRSIFPAENAAALNSRQLQVWLEGGREPFEFLSRSLCLLL